LRPALTMAWSSAMRIRIIDGERSATVPVCEFYVAQALGTAGAARVL
jgi:hypothetical protein